MKFEKFVELYSHTPSTLDELAYLAEDIEDRPKFKKAAEEFLKAKSIFEMEIEKSDFQRG